MAKKLTKHEKQIVIDMKEIRTLLAEFGLVLHGYDPGVTAFPKEGVRAFVFVGGGGHGFFGEPFAFNRTTWSWLRPLLEELLKRRRGELR